MRGIVLIRRIVYASLNRVRGIGAVVRCADEGGPQARGARIYGIRERHDVYCSPRGMRERVREKSVG